MDVNSGTMNHEGVRRVGVLLRAELDALGFETRWIDMASVDRAGHLFGERRGSRGKRVLLIGHLDTVFEADSPFQKFERDGDQARGPGTEDMKGGDVVVLFALKALASVGALEGTTITAAFTGDEENPGSPLAVSRRDLIEAGRRSDAALEFEGLARARRTRLRHHRAAGVRGMDAPGDGPRLVTPRGSSRGTRGPEPSSRPPASSRPSARNSPASRTSRSAPG